MLISIHNYAVIVGNREKKGNGFSFSSDEISYFTKLCPDACLCILFMEFEGQGFSA